MTITMRALLMLLTAGAWAQAPAPESIPLFSSVDSAFQGKMLLTETATPPLPSSEGEHSLSIEPGPEVNASPEWLFRFTEPFFQSWPSLFLDIEYVDNGAGVIQPRLLQDDTFAGSWAAPVREVSFTRLNTGKIRHAVFEFRVPKLDWLHTSHAHLQVAGLQHLRRISALLKVSDQQWQQLQESVPVEVTPMVQLQRPMRINCTVGIPDIGNPPPLETAMDNIREYAPLAKVLGFTSIECFVRWDLLEPKQGHFDFSHYDRIVAAIRRYDLKWFPNLVITSAFALPSWYFSSAEYAPFRCLEHNEVNQSPNIWNPVNREHVTRVLDAFGEHYGPMGVLEAVRLGPSGNFGEAQYPAGAGGALGFQQQKMHAHIGWWAGGPEAQRDFQQFLAKRYPSITELNTAWDEHYTAREEVRPQLPETYRTRRGRLDMTEWYTGRMAEWCGFWAEAARHALPEVMIYQSAGGWGYRESGTDFTALADSAKGINGGIRLTNETDSFEQNYYATRLAASAARLYGISLGYEPAGSHTARGVTGRFFSTMTTNGDNLYTRHGVLFTNPDAVQHWLRDYPLLDQRAKPLIEVAIYYPETMSQLDDGAFRHLYGWGFNPRAAEVRRRIDADFLDERLLRAGFLDRYKALVCCWGNIVETDVQQIVNRWLRAGGTIIYPARNNQETVEGDTRTFDAWERGDTGTGRFWRFKGDMEPLTLYGDFVRDALLQTPGLHRWTKTVLKTRRPERVFVSVLENGTLAALNYNDEIAEIAPPEAPAITVPAFSIKTTVLPGG